MVIDASAKTKVQAMERSNEQYGNWKKLQNLGSGGFGVVSLWENQTTKEKVAIKVCQQLQKKNLTRWHQEVLIMKKLDHPGLVKFKDVPIEIETNYVQRNSNSMALGMEYCEHGDLRRMLTQAEHCCGIKESEVRSVLNNIGSAIDFLHSNKIIHRDIKPENIVLKSIDSSKVMYKIIDLGYAKELQGQSIAQSFVGTMHYLAPEFLLADQASLNYTSTVDYWSFGLVAFECITGRRPFYPNLEILQIFNLLKDKKTDQHICTTDTSGKEELSSEIPQPHYLNPIFAEKLSAWLQTMFKLDPKVRGGKNSATPWFKGLKEILEQKVVQVFNTTALEMLTFDVDANPEMSISQLKNKLYEQTEIQPGQQILLLENGEMPEYRVKILSLFEKSQSCTLYLFAYNNELKALPTNIPQTVSDLLTKGKEYTSRRLKRILSLATNAISRSIQSCQQSLKALNALYVSVDRQNQKCKALDSDLNTKYWFTTGMFTVFKESLSQDMKVWRTIDYPSVIGASDELYGQWHQTAQWAADCEARLAETRDFIAQRRDLGGDDHVTFTNKLRNFAMSTQKTLTDLLRVTHQKHDELRKLIRSNDYQRKPEQALLKLKDHILQFVHGTIADNKKRKSEICEFIRSLVDRHESLFHRLHQANQVKCDIVDCSQQISRSQAERQHAVWGLIQGLKRDVIDVISLPPPQESVADPDPTPDMQRTFSDLQSLVEGLQGEMEDIVSLDWEFTQVEPFTLEPHSDQHPTDEQLRHESSHDDVTRSNGIADVTHSVSAKLAEVAIADTAV